jgi:hypothetical protein
MRIRIRLYLDLTCHINVDPDPILIKVIFATTGEQTLQGSSELPQLPNFDFDPDPAFDIYADSDVEKILDLLLCPELTSPHFMSSPESHSYQSPP